MAIDDKGSGTVKPPDKLEESKTSTPTRSGTSSASHERADAAPGQKRVLTGVELDHKRMYRTGGVTESGADEYRRLGVNPLLDNRLGDQRPEVAEWPAKPQQIDGPEVGHFGEHAERFGDQAEKFRNLADPAGAKSEGPHGLGPHGVTVGDAHGQPVAAEAGAGDSGDPRNPA